MWDSKVRFKSQGLIIFLTSATNTFNILIIIFILLPLIYVATKFIIIGKFMMFLILFFFIIQNVLIMIMVNINKKPKIT